jgi:Flp pilus assembly protein TadD
MNLGLARQQDGEPDDAVRLFRRVQALRPDWPDAGIQIGQILLDGGHADQALLEFQDVLRMTPDHPSATWAMAVALDRLGRGEEARLVWQRLHELPGGEPHRQMAGERLP